MDPIIAANKDIAETLFGYRHGRPTISRRAGRQIARATGWKVQTSVDVFHAGLAVLVLAGLAKAFGREE